MDYDIININGRGYYRICPSTEIGEGRRIRAEIDNDCDLVIFRIDGKLYCVSNVCPHKRESKIYKGFIEGYNVECPMHGWTFSLINGENINGGKSIAVYDVLENDGFVFVEKKEAPKPKWMI